MNTKLQIIQGAGQIGGNIILIEGEESRLLFDFGIPLTELDGNPTDLKLNDEKVEKYLPDISDLYKSKQEKQTLIFLSHAHPDHFGLLRYVDKSIPVYTMKITKDLMEKCSKILYDNLFNELNLVELDETVETPDFSVKGFCVDHSVAGACAFRITDKKTGKVILYSGDIRVHGRNSDKTELFVKENHKPDYLILEGTTLSREETKLKTEQDIEDEMTEIFSEDKMSIVCCSPLNIDRIVSVYNACKRADKTFVIDPYTALMLETFRGSDLPYYRSENIKVYCARNTHSNRVFENPKNKKFGLNKIAFKDIMETPEQYVIKDNFRVSSLIGKSMNIEDINLVYSYWEGYLEDEKYHWHKYLNQLKKVHTSGHIAKSDLIKLVNGLNPEKVIPIHTLANNKFKEFFGEKVLELNKDKFVEIS